MRRILFGILTLSLFVQAVSIAQPPPPSSGRSASPSTDSNKFVSLEGGFSIDLPSFFSSYGGIKPVPGFSTGGSLFTWRTASGGFQIGYVDRVLNAGEQQKVLNDTADGLIEEHKRNGQTLIHKKSIESNGHPGIEVRMTIEGGTAQTRYILAEKRMYILTTGWAIGETAEAREKVLNSFKLIDAAEMIAKRLEAATPAPLPQEPRPEKYVPDVAQESLAGRPKRILSSKQYLTGGSTANKIPTSDEYFDLQGSLTKSISYDYRGNPSHVTAYGFIEGRRVSRSGNFLDYEYNPPPPAAAPSAAPIKPIKPADSRYGTAYEFKTDEKGRIIEKITLSNRGETTWKTTYEYKEGMVERVSYSADGKVQHRSISKLGDRGQVIEQTIFSTHASFPDDSVYKYRYLEYDKNGNWLRREIEAKSAKYGGGTNDLNYIEFREISYH